MANVLIVDDQKNLCAILAEALLTEGWNPVCAYNLAEGKQLVSQGDFDIVLLDIKLPDGNGLEALPEFVNTGSQPEVIIMTGHGDSEAAAMALKYGVWDYIKKPFNNTKVNLSIKRALEFRQAKLSSRSGRILKRNNIVGASVAISETLERTAESAGGDHSILITGETGTGKELFARAIHLNSPREDNHFIVVDCSALNESLIESSLFGHVKGAFTDARQDRDGLILMAHQGTLFLDEIGELSMSIQKKFLRVLEDKHFRPIGGRKEQKSDFRLVSATNRNLEEMVEEGTFRNDLLYRIKSQKLILPPLRDRKEDIPELVSHHMSRICRRLGIQPKNIDPEFMECLYAYDWPGNVRELVNVLDQVICSARTVQTLFHKHLPVDIRSASFRDDEAPEAMTENKSESSPAFFSDLPLTSWQVFRKKVEKEYFQRLISDSQGDIKQMVKVSGMSKSRIYDLVNKHDLTIRKKAGA